MSGRRDEAEELLKDVLHESAELDIQLQALKAAVVRKDTKRVSALRNEIAPQIEKLTTATDTFLQVREMATERVNNVLVIATVDPAGRPIKGALVVIQREVIGYPLAGLHRNGEFNMSRDLGGVSDEDGHCLVHMPRTDETVGLEVELYAHGAWRVHGLQYHVNYKGGIQIERLIVYPEDGAGFKLGVKAKKPSKKKRSKV